MSKPLTSIEQDPEFNDLLPSGKALAKRIDEACIDADPIDLLDALFLKFRCESIRLLPTFEVFMRHVEDTRRRLERRGREVFREPDIRGLN